MANILTVNDQMLYQSTYHVILKQERRSYKLIGSMLGSHVDLKDFEDLDITDTSQLNHMNKRIIIRQFLSIQ